MSQSFPVQTRTTFGTKAAAALRDQAQAPLTVARSGAESIHFTIDAKAGQRLLAQVGRVVELDADGTTHSVLVQGAQIHPTRDYIQQIDVLEVDDEKVVKVKVSLNPITDDSPGIKAGGLLEAMLRKVEIKCRAKDIPAHLDVDLAGVGLGQTVYAENVSLPEGAQLVTLPRVAIMTVIKTRGMRRAEAAAGRDGGS